MHPSNVHEGMSEKRWGLVTGASNGIGLHLSRAFAKNGINLILVSQDEERLARSAAEISGAFGVGVHTITKDLSANRAADEIYADVYSHNKFVDILVNNAGSALAGPFATTDWETELKMINLNILSLTRLTKLFLGDMLARGSGRILNVASNVGFQPGPNIAVYSATKAFVRQLSESVNHEIRGSGVSVSTLCPGATRTELFERGGWNLPWITRAFMLTPEDVAKAAYDGMMKGKPIIIPGWFNKLLYVFSHILPRAVVIRIADRLITKR